MNERRTSYPRFRRVKPAVRIEITEDDAAILQHVHRNRFIRTSDLYRLLSHRSPDRISRRLTSLYRSGFLDRPLSQIDHFRGAGSQPLVYGLDAAGARYLSEVAGVAVSSNDWKGRNRRFTRDNLDHTLAVASFMVDMTVACGRRSDIDLIDTEEIVEGAPRPMQHSARSCAWLVSLPWHGHRADVTLAPDAMFGLRRRGAGPAKRSFVFVEVDRGTMTIAPSETALHGEAFLYRSSILRKLLTYAVSHQDRVHQENFGIPAARVLFLTRTAKRAEQMRQAAERFVVTPMKVSTALFLFGTLPEVENPLTTPFRDASGNEVLLAPAASP